MKKDFINVTITFSLILSMLLWGNYFYSKKVFAEKIAQGLLEQQANLALQLQQKKLLEEELAQKAEEARLADLARIKQEQLAITQAANEQARQQAIYAAQQAELARQKAAAQLLADQQAAAQKAAQTTTPKPVTRKSRAS